MKALTAVLFVLAHTSISSCRTQHASHDVRELEVANFAPRKVPTLAQLIPILEGPDLPEVKLRKLRKLIPIYDDLTQWRIDHSERLVEIMPYKKKTKPVAFILASNDYLKLKKPDSDNKYDHNSKNNANNYKEHKSHTNDSDESSENTKFDVIHRKGYKEHPHTKSDHSRHSYKDKNYKKYHSSEFSHKNGNKKHKNNDNKKSDFTSKESGSESNESSNEHNESDNVTETDENKYGNDKKSKEKTSENDVKSDKKEHEQGSHTKRPYRKSYRNSKYFKHSYKDCKGRDCKDNKKHRQGHSSERDHNKIYAKNKKTDNSGSYSNEFESKSNESNEDNESWSQDTESKSTENKSIEDKNVKETRLIHNSNKSRLLTALNKYSIHDSTLQEASNSASKGFLSSRPYFVPHSNISSVIIHYTKPDITLSDSNKTDSISSQSNNSLTANSESKVNVTANELRTVSQESQKSTENDSVHAVSLESNDLSEDNVEFKTDEVASSNNLSESMSDSLSDESLSNTEVNESKPEADSGIGLEVDSKTVESDEKELADAQFRSILPVESPTNKYSESSDLNSNDLETGTEFISDLESNQSLKSTESQSDSNDIPEATTAELAVSTELKSDAFESVTDENSSISAISNESAPDSSGPETPFAESTSESVSDSKSTESISEKSVLDVSKVPESVSESNYSRLDSISDIDTDGVFDVKPNEYYISTEKSNELNGSEYISEGNSNESVSVSYDGNESADLKSEEKNELTSTNSNVSKSNIADVSESGLSNQGYNSVQLTDINKPYETKSESQTDIMEVGTLVSDENDVDLDVTEKSNESQFDENGEILENKLGLDEHHIIAHGKHISDRNYDIKSVDTNQEDSATNIEKEDFVEVITPNSRKVSDDEETRTPHVLLVENHHYDTEAPNHEISMKEYNKYEIGDVSSYVVKHNKIINNEESVATPVVLKDNENERNIVNSTEHEKQREFTPINIIIKKNDDKDSITKNILIEYDTSNNNDIIIDARTDKQEDLNDNEKRDGASDVQNQYIDVNTNTQQLKTNQELATNVNCNSSSNNLSVVAKEKLQHKTYKLSFIFN